jgi:phosphate transporter
LPAFASSTRRVSRRPSRSASCPQAPARALLADQGSLSVPRRFDKITGSKTKDHYLENSLTTYYPYLASTKHLLETQDKHLLTTYARVVVGGDRELASRQLGSQLREKVVIERDTVWRQMVHASRTNDTAGGFLTAVPDPRSRGAAESKERWRPVLKTPLGTLYRPAFFTRGAALFSLGLVVLALLSSGAIPTFERVEERNCCAMLVFCTILWATEVGPRPLDRSRNAC